MLILGAVLTERASVEDRLERARARLAEAQEVARIGSWVWDVGADRVICSWTKLYRLYGIEPQSVDLTYESFLAGVHPDDRERVASAVTRALEERVRSPSSTAPFCRTAARVGCTACGRPATGDGDSQRMLGTCQDVTDRRRVDEARDSILSTISHELRTPLTSIVGFSVTLDERAAELSEDVRVEIYSHLSAESRRLDSLLSDLLDADRLRHGSLQPTFKRVDVGRLVADVVARFCSGACIGWALDPRRGGLGGCRG